MFKSGVAKNRKKSRNRTFYFQKCLLFVGRFTNAAVVPVFLTRLIVRWYIFFRLTGPNKKTAICHALHVCDVKKTLAELSQLKLSLWLGLLRPFQSEAIQTWQRERLKMAFYRVSMLYTRAAVWSVMRLVIRNLGGQKPSDIKGEVSTPSWVPCVCLWPSEPL